MKTVSINLKEDDIKTSQNVPIHTCITLDAAFINMPAYLNTGELGVLVLLQHQGPLTLLNLTGVTPYVLLCFDDYLHYH